MQENDLKQLEPPKREPIFLPGGIIRLVLALIGFAIGTAVLYYTKYQYY